VYADALCHLYDEIAGYPDERDVTERLQPSDTVILSETYPNMVPALERYVEDVRPAYVACLDDWYDEHMEAINTTFCERYSRSKIDRGVWFGNTLEDMEIVDVRDSRNVMPFPQYVNWYEEDIAAADNPHELEDSIEGASRHWTANRVADFDDWYERLWDALQVGTPSGIERIRAHYPDEETEAVIGTLQAKTAERLRAATPDPDTVQSTGPRTFGS
jgi:hypothetical protein